MIDKDYINLDDSTSKRKLYAAIAPLKGMHEVTIKPVRATRRQKANRYLFGVVYKSFREFLAEQGQVLTTDEIHSYLKLKFLPREVMNPLSGEVLAVVPGTSHDRDVKEFADYIDNCIRYLADMFNIVVPSPDLYGIERPAASAPNRASAA